MTIRLEKTEDEARAAIATLDARVARAKAAIREVIVGVCVDLGIMPDTRSMDYADDMLSDLVYELRTELEDERTKAGDALHASEDRDLRANRPNL